MHTILRSDTQTISIAAPPAAVLDYLADPEQLPRWAPAFAQAVRYDGDQLIVTSGGADLPVRLRIVPEVGVVDILDTEHERGAFLRVVPNGSGSELTFTVFHRPGTSDAEIAAQYAVICGELAAVRQACERVPAPAA